MKSSFLFHFAVAWSSKELKLHRKGGRRQRRGLCPKPSLSSCGAGPLQPLLLGGRSAPAPPHAGAGLLQAAEGKAQAIWGFPHRFWKFCFLLFGTTIRGGTGRDRSLWLWHLPQWLKFYYLKSHHYKLNFIIFFSLSLFLFF